MQSALMIPVFFFQAPKFSFKHSITLLSNVKLSEESNYFGHPYLIFVDNASRNIIEIGGLTVNSDVNLPGPENRHWKSDLL